jgi:dienelactone hydrolase
MFHGIADDYVPIQPCRDYVGRLRAVGADVALTEYPNAQHGFDGPYGSLVPAVVPNGQTSRNCTLKEKPEGVVINAVTGKRFTTKGDPCVELNAHMGYNPVATRAAQKAVSDFLTTALSLTR